MNHTLPTLFRCYSSELTVHTRPLDGLRFGNHVKTSTWAEQGANYSEMSKCTVVMQQSLIITHHNSWRGSWQLQMGSAWSCFIVMIMSPLIKNNYSCTGLIILKCFRKYTSFFKSILYIENYSYFFQILLTCSLFRELFSVIMKCTGIKFYWDRFLKEGSALLFKSNLNESVSVKVAHVCSWHIIHRGTLFNGPLTSRPIRLQDGV